MKTFVGKQESISGTWYDVVVKVNTLKEAVSKLYVGQRKSYGIVQAIKGRFKEN